LTESQTSFHADSRRLELEALVTNTFVYPLHQRMHVDKQEGDSQSFTVNSKSSRKRLFIGNLPDHCEDLHEKLLRHLNKNTQADIRGDQLILGDSSGAAAHALLSYAGNLNILVAKLHNTVFQGNTLNVQIERRRKSSGSHTNTACSKKGFGNAWATPAEPVSASTAPSLAVGEKERLEEVAEKIEEIVSDEIHNSVVNGGDPLTAALISTAALALVATAGFEGQPTSNVRKCHDKQKQDETNDFRTRRQESLSALMAEYGDFDPDWKEKQFNDVDQEVEIAVQPSAPPENRLMPHGKAPIHIQFSSFGYIHGVPADCRNGWSQSSPLSPFDCRDLSQVSHWLSWQDGLSNAVKRDLMKNESPSVQDFANNIADQALTVLVKAIEAGHGYADCLSMNIFVGSSSGKHRSVAICELAAAQLRTILRLNDGSRVSQPCSVGTAHRDIQRKVSNQISSKGKQKDLEDD
jgi:hypothetical protein